MEKALSQETKQKIKELEEKAEQLRVCLKLSQQKYQIIQDELLEFFKQNRKVTSIEAKLQSLDLILEDAKQQVKEITEEQLREIASYKTPPQQVQNCMEGFFLLMKGKVLSWKEIKTEMQSSTFVQKMLNQKLSTIKQENVVKFKKEYILKNKWNLEDFQRASKAIGPIGVWIQGVQEYKEETLKAKPFKKQIEKFKEFKQQKLNEEQSLFSEMQNMKIQLEEIEVKIESVREEKKQSESQSQNVDPKITQIYSEATKRLTFNIPRENNSDDFLTGSDLDFNEELGIMNKLSALDPVARRSRFEEALMFDKKEQTQLKNVDIDQMLLENQDLKERVKKLENTLRDREQIILNAIEEKGEKQNNLMIPIEKQINRKQTQILRDKSGEAEALKFRMDMKEQELQSMKLKLEEEINQINTDKIIQERKYEESINKMNLDFKIMEEKYKQEIEELQSKLSSENNNDEKLEKLKNDVIKRNKIIELLEGKQLKGLSELEKLVSDISSPNYHQIQKIIETFKNDQRKKTTINEFSIIDSEGIFLGFDEYEFEDKNNANENDLLGEQKKALDNMEQTWQQKKMELLQTQQEQQKEQVKLKDDRIYSLTKENSELKTTIYQNKKNIEVLQSEIVNLKGEADFNEKKNEGLRNQEKHFRTLKTQLEAKNKQLSTTLTTVYFKLDELDEENDRKDAEIELFKEDYDVALKQIENFLNLKKVAEKKFAEDKEYIQKLEEKISSQSRELEINKLKENNFNTKLQEKDALICDQKTQIDVFESEIKRLKEKIDFLQEQLNSAEQRLAKSAKDTKVLEDEIQSNKKQIANLTEKVKEKETDQQISEFYVNKVNQQQVDLFKDENEQLNSHLKDALAENQESLQKIFNLQNEKIARDKRILELEQELKEMQQIQLSSLEMRKHSIIRREDQIFLQEKGINLLKQQNKDLQEEIRTLQEKIQDYFKLKENENMNKQMIEEFNRQNEKLQQNLKNLELENKQLKNQVIQIEENLTNQFIEEKNAQDKQHADEEIKIKDDHYFEQQKLQRQIDQAQSDHEYQLLQQEKQFSEELAAQISKITKQLTEEHKQEIEGLLNRHQEEVDNLQQQLYEYLQSQTISQVKNEEKERLEEQHNKKIDSLNMMLQNQQENFEQEKNMLILEYQKKLALLDKQRKSNIIDPNFQKKLPLQVNSGFNPELKQFESQQKSQLQELQNKHSQEIMIITERYETRIVKMRTELYYQNLLQQANLQNFIQAKQNEDLLENQLSILENQLKKTEQETRLRRESMLNRHQQQEQKILFEKNEKLRELQALLDDQQMQKDIQVENLKEKFDKEKEDSLKHHLKELEALKVEFQKMQEETGHDLEEQRTLFEEKILKLNQEQQEQQSSLCVQHVEELEKLLEQNSQYQNKIDDLTRQQEEMIQKEVQKILSSQKQKIRQTIVDQQAELNLLRKQLELEAQKKEQQKNKLENEKFQLFNHQKKKKSLLIAPNPSHKSTQTDALEFQQYVSPDAEIVQPIEVNRVQSQERNQIPQQEANRYQVLEIRRIQPVEVKQSQPYEFKQNQSFEFQRAQTFEVRQSHPYEIKQNQSFKVQKIQPIQANQNPVNSIQQNSPFEMNKNQIPFKVNSIAPSQQQESQNYQKTMLPQQNVYVKYHYDYNEYNRDFDERSHGNYSKSPVKQSPNYQTQESPKISLEVNHRFDQQSQQQVQTNFQPIPIRSVVSQNAQQFKKEQVPTEKKRYLNFILEKEQKK